MTIAGTTSATAEPGAGTSAPGCVPRALWIGFAACRGMNPSVFYPGRGDNVGMQQAKLICARCDARQECLEEALIQEAGWPGPDGVRGGLSAKERRNLLRARRS